MDNQEIKELSREVSEIYLTNFISSERNNHQCQYSLDDCISFYLTGYKFVLKSLVNEEIFNEPINQLASSAALVYVNKYLAEDIYADINSCTKTFITAYKHAVSTIKKDLTLPLTDRPQHPSHPKKQRVKVSSKTKKTFRNHC